MRAGIERSAAGDVGSLCEHRTGARTDPSVAARRCFLEAQRAGLAAARIGALLGGASRLRHRGETAARPFRDARAAARAGPPPARTCEARRLHVLRALRRADRLST